MKSISLTNCIRKSLIGVVSLVLMSGAFQVVHADVIPYPNVGVPNPITYTFTAASTGDVVAYFAGSAAAFDNQLGLLDNGVLTSAGYGLDNHTSSLGDSFNFGTVTAGDTLVFVLHNLTLGMDAYSDPAMNVGYDSDGTLGHNHIYSTPYTATSPIIDSIPIGTYVGFEDLPFPNSDFNYFDESFVFTNINTVQTTVPEPSTFVLLAAGLAGVGFLRRRISK